MALVKTKNWKGQEANYWKIITSISDFLTNKTRVILGLYLSKEIRDLSVENFLEREAVEISGVDLTREQEYTAIKLTEYFSDAVDEI